MKKFYQLLTVILLFCCSTALANDFTGTFVQVLSTDFDSVSPELKQKALQKFEQTKIKLRIDDSHLYMGIGSYKFEDEGIPYTTNGQFLLAIEENEPDVFFVLYLKDRETLLSSQMRFQRVEKEE